MNQVHVYTSLNLHTSPWCDANENKIRGWKLRRLWAVWTACTSIFYTGNACSSLHLISCEHIILTLSPMGRAKITVPILKTYSAIGSRSEDDWKAGCQPTCPASKRVLSCSQGKKTWESELYPKQGGALENKLLFNCISHFLLQNKRWGKMSWPYFTSSSFPKHKNLPLFLLLTRAQSISSPLDPHTGTHYNYLEMVPWESRTVKKPKATRRDGKFKAWAVGTSASCPERLLQFFWAPILESDLLPVACRQERRVGAPRQHWWVICIQQGYTGSWGKEKGQRPVNLKKKVASVLGAFVEGEAEKQCLLTLAFPNSHSLYHLYRVTCFWAMLCCQSQNLILLRKSYLGVDRNSAIHFYILWKLAPCWECSNAQ